MKDAAHAFAASQRGHVQLAAVRALSAHGINQPDSYYLITDDAPHSADCVSRTERNYMSTGQGEVYMPDFKDNKSSIQRPLLYIYAIGLHQPHSYRPRRTVYARLFYLKKAQ